MPIRKNLNGEIVVTKKDDHYESGILEGTGVTPASSTVIADNSDVLKQVQFDPSAQATNTTVYLKTSSATPGTDVIITFPSVSGTLATTAGSGGITQLTGDVIAGPGSGSVAATLVNASVTGQALTGYSSGAGTVSASDTILTAINKLNGNTALKANSSLIGAPNGIASLDGTGKVPASQLPVGVFDYLGNWDASTNTPTLADGSGVAGAAYRVNVAGTQNLGSGPQTFVVGDFVIYDGSIWQKSHSGADAVTSVNTLTGAVVLTTSNISEGSNLYYTDTRVRATALTGFSSTTGNITASDTVLTAIDKLDGNLSNKQGIGNYLTTLSGDVATVDDGQDVYTKLLMHLDGTTADIIGNTIALYSGSSSYTTGKFGQGLTVTSGGFPYVANYPSAFNLGTGNFTFDLWAKSSGLSHAGYFLSAGQYGSSQDYALWVSATGAITWDNPLVASSPGAFPVDGAWHHIAFVRNGNVHTIYVDGVSVATTTSAYTYSYTNTNGLSFGGVFADSGQTLILAGSIDEVRASVGIARYTGSFTPPASPYGPTGVTTIQSNVVSNAKLAQMAAHTYKGNNTGSTANAADITSTQLTADLNQFTSSLQGLTPASGGGTTNFLRADGTFAAPPGATSGTVTSVALTVPAEFTISGSPITTSGTLAISKANQSANQVYAGPSTGSATTPSFRPLVGADLPNPSSSSLGGVQSISAISSKFLTSISTSGVPASAQPAFTDISGSLPNSQLAAMNAHTFKGNNAGSTATPVDLTQTELTAELNTFTSSLQGVVPASGGGTSNFLRADGSFAVPPGTNAGTVTSVALADGSSTPIYSISGSPVTSSGTLTATLTTQVANRVFAGPSTGSPAQPTFRALIGTDLPNPSSTTLGGVQSKAAVTNQFLTSISTAGVPTLAQPAFTDISGTATVAQGGTGQTSYTDGQLLIGNSSGNTLGKATITAGTNIAITNGASSITVGITGQVAIANGGTGQATKAAGFDALSPMTASGDVIYGGASGTGTRLAKGTDGQVLTLASGLPSWAAAGSGSSTAPTVQKFTSGSGTYTRPTSPTPLYIRVQMVGGGGGGGGGNTSTRGTTGGNSTFGSSLLVANGGTGGLRGNNGASGGTASLGTGPIGTALTGGTGSSGGSDVADTGGGPGASTPFGGGGGGGAASNAGDAAAANTGSGGGGGGTTTNAFSGTGGGAGGYVDAIITSPSSTYAYAIGTGGGGSAAGASSGAGGSGGSGYIIVWEHYQ